MAHAADALARTRVLIDAVDDGLVLLLAMRRQLALAAGRRKRHAGLAGADADREQQVHLRAARLARSVDLPDGTARALMAVAIADARRCQGLAHATELSTGMPPPGMQSAPDVDQGAAAARHDIIPSDMTAPHHHRGAADGERHGQRWLRLLPPPARWSMLLRVCPPAVQQRVLERAMARVLATPLRGGALAFLQDRRLGIEVVDLRLRWVVTLKGDRLLAVEGPAEASVRGSATDLLLLASRLEDADTLFFQRRIVLTGDTELGLTARNLLDRLPWDQVPLALRIFLNRGARLAQAARSAYRAD